MAKKDHVCSECGGPVVVDAWAQWDIEQQKFVLVDTFDYTYCRQCDGGGNNERWRLTGEWIDIDDKENNNVDDNSNGSGEGA